MTVWQTGMGMGAAALLWGFGLWREKRHQLGMVPMIPPIYIQIAAITMFLALAANLIALLTGVDWKHPN